MLTCGAAADHMDSITSALVVTERLLKGSDPEAVERTLTYRGDALAAVYVELKATECTVAWPVIAGIDLAELFDAYDEFAGDAKTSVEWWIGNDFFEVSLGHRQEIKSAALELREQEKRIGSPLDLVQLVCDDLVFEVTFDGVRSPAPATRLAVVVPSVSEQLLSLFSRFHKNEFVRTRADVAYIALMAPLGQGFQMLRTFN
jgi:hypothetical protein